METIPQGESTSPTVAMDLIHIIAEIETAEKREKDLPGTFLTC